MPKQHHNFKTKHNKNKSNSVSTEAAKTVSYNDNHIYFRTKVNTESITKLITIINKKNQEFEELLENELIESATPNNLWLHITSYGGSVNECFRAIDAITSSKIPIYTIIDGYAASSGSMMALVGKRRFMTPSAYVLIHQLSSTGPTGTFWRIKDKYANVVQHMDDIYNLYMNNTNLNREELEQLMSHDLWWRSDICLKYGIVDEIYK